MSSQTMSSGGRKGGHASALRVGKIVFTLVPWARWVTLGMIVLGILAGLAELVGITFMVSATFQMTGTSGQISGGLAMVSDLLRNVGLQDNQLTMLIILITAVVVKIALTFVNANLNTVVAQRISENIRNEIYDQLLDISLPSLMHNDRGELITILATESYEVANAHSIIVRAGVNVGTAIIFGLGLVAAAWQIAAVVVAAGAVYSAFMLAYTRRFYWLGRDTSAALETTMKLSWTSLQAIKSVRSFGIEEQTRRAFRVASTKLSRSLGMAETYGHITSAFSEAIVFVVLVLIIFSATMWQISLPAVVGSIVLLYRLQPQVREFYSNVLTLVKAEVPIERIRKLLARDDKTYITRGQHPVSQVRTGIEFRNVTYHYPGSPGPSLSDVSFTIPSGKRTAIVGASGSGKTTIVNLLLALDRPSNGSVLVDGIDLYDLSKTDWARIVATAGQDVELIEGSIRENLQFYRDRPDEAIHLAAKLAGASGFIENMPGGYDEWAGDEAMRLSGGQRQRLGLARALVDQPQVLVLDEATNGLDEDTENVVLGMVFEASRDKTLIFVTHRRALLPMMHRIIEIDLDGDLTVTDQEPK